jgi:N-acetylglucosaminyldiphosphoundecaprenol N-acetyl-beta-D-mannosaminyltransferase
MTDSNFLSDTKVFTKDLSEIPVRKLLISTINAYSYIIARTDQGFAEALRKSDILLPDGISIVHAKYILNGEKIRKIAGADLFNYEMDRLNSSGGSCFFLGSKETTLKLILNRLSKDYPHVRAASFSPPFADSFSADKNKEIIETINRFKPDVLFIGMTAPKQEKWAYSQFDKLDAVHICCIGAVFDFYAGTIKRAPRWMINMGLEWFHRLIKDPRRMWRRYLIGNSKFIWLIHKEKVNKTT